MRPTLKTHDPITYFKWKFAQIPEEQWCEGAYALSGQHCAYGHCGVKGSDEIYRIPEALALSDLFTAVGVGPTNVNDNNLYLFKFPQPTPKQRILAFLDALEEFYK